MGVDRRSFFKTIAGVAALPLLAKLPIPAKRAVERVGTWATVRMENGAFAAITITNPGAGYGINAFAVINGKDPVKIHHG